MLRHASGYSSRPFWCPSLNSLVLASPPPLHQLSPRQTHASSHAQDVPILTAADARGLAAVCGSSQVLLSTAGPFARYGDAVLEAALQERTHYADITGGLSQRGPAPGGRD